MSTTEILLENGNRYYYTVSNYNAENPLGVIKATLKEFIVYSSNNKEIVGKFYKTNEGNWYDVSISDNYNSLFSVLIKKAIDESEKTCPKY